MMMFLRWTGTLRVILFIDLKLCGSNIFLSRFRLKILTERHPSWRRISHITTAISHEAHLWSWTLYRKKRIWENIYNDHNSNYPAAASILMLFRKRKKKVKKIINKKKDSYYIHIFTFPLVIMWNLQTLVELYRWQETDGAGGGIERWKKGRQSEVKDADGNGTCVGRKPAGEEMFSFISTSGKEFMPQFISCCFFSAVSGYGRVCLRVTECLFSDRRGGHEEGKAKGEKRSPR